MVTLHSAQVIGLDAILINVEVDCSPGLHIFSIVGLAEKEIQESRDRVSVALRTVGAEPPRSSGRVIVNLAPADITKSGPAFDLPIALGYLLASGQAKFDPGGKIFVGELGLGGQLKPVRGALAAAILAKEKGFKTIYLPKSNGEEASLVKGLEIKEAGSIVELLDELEGRASIPPLAAKKRSINPQPETLDFASIRGQESAKRALVIAAAGGHNILLTGPPGTGKTILARAVASILPPMTEDEIIEVTRIYSSSVIPGNSTVVEHRPFRSPHHTASAIAITGGGSKSEPGEVTLAHRGILFLDELPQFQPHVLEALRQPMEDRVITISRAEARRTFPADFTLVATMNPCPCGNFSNPTKICRCSPGEIARYQRRISGPIMDRIDLVIEVGNVDMPKLEAESDSSENERLRSCVIAAKSVQTDRFGQAGTKTNSAMTMPDIKKFCRLDKTSSAALKNAYERMNLSVRSYFRIIKVARTIADLSGQENITKDHILEALQYRPKIEV